MKQDNSYWTSVLGGTGAQSTLEGLSFHLCVNNYYLDSATDATELSDIFEAFVTQRLQRLVSELSSKKRLTAKEKSLLENLNELTATNIGTTGAYLVTALKVAVEIGMDTIIRRCTRMAKGDVAAADPWSNSFRASIEARGDRGEILIPPICLGLKAIYNGILQVAGPEVKTGYLGVYMTMINKQVTAAQIETHLDTLRADIDAQNVLALLGMSPIKYTSAMMNKLYIYPKYSAFNWLITNFLPNKDDTAETKYELDASDPATIVWVNSLPPTEWLSAAVLFRSTAATAKPGFITVCVAPNVGKQSIYYFSTTATAPTEYPDSSTGFDWIRSVTTRQSRTHVDWLSTASPGITSKLPGLASATAWNKLLVDFLTDHPDGSFRKMPALSKVLVDRLDISMEDGSRMVATCDPTVPTVENDPLTIRKEVEGFIQALMTNPNSNMSPGDRAKAIGNSDARKGNPNRFQDSVLRASVEAYRSMKGREKRQFGSAMRKEYGKAWDYAMRK